MKLAIIRKDKKRAYWRFIIELPDTLGEVYKEDFLQEHFLFYVTMAIGDLTRPTHIPLLDNMNKDFLSRKLRVIEVLDNEDEE